MTTDLFVRYFHFLGIFAMFALLTVQHMLLKGQVAAGGMKKIAIIDAAYGASALVVLLCGLGLWLWVGKPAGFYSHNWVFHTKVTLFVVVGILSIFPTLFILKNRKKTTTVDVPKYIVMLVRFELLLLCIIPLLAVLMANGVGYIR
jgi:Predicted membrane protein